MLVQHGDENFESLLSIESSSPRHFARFFSKISINPQGQLCLWLNRPMVFSKCLSQVSEMGSKYGHSVMSPPAPGCQGSSQNADAAVLLINDSAVLKHMASRSGSGQSSVDPSDLSLSDSRSALLVGVVSNLLKARGHEVNHHHGNWPLPMSTVGGSTTDQV